MLIICSLLCSLTNNNININDNGSEEKDYY